MLAKLLGFSAVVGGLLLFIMISPLLIAAVWLLITGMVSFAILSFIVWAMLEYLKERKGQ